MQVLKVALKLVEGVRTAIMKVGLRRTGQMFETYEKPPGVFGWTPQVRDWLNDSTFIRYLGALGVNPKMSRKQTMLDPRSWKKQTLTCSIINGPTIAGQPYVATTVGTCRSELANSRDGW